MNEVLNLSLPMVAGMVLSLIYFGGLWWTVQKGISSPQPGLWFLGSRLLRTGIVLAGFYWLARGDWQRILVSLLGFMLMRMIIARWTGLAETRGNPVQVVKHAP